MSNLVPFILAVVAVIINGVPQLLYAQARGFNPVLHGQLQLLR